MSSYINNDCFGNTEIKKRDSVQRPTIEEKYNWLLSQINITDVDLWEKDAMLKMSVYFQFYTNMNTGETSFSVEDAIELAMKDWYYNQNK